MNSRFLSIMLLVMLVTTMARLFRQGGRWYLAYQIQLGLIALITLAAVILDKPGATFIGWGLFIAFVVVPAMMLARASRLLAAGHVQRPAQLWKQVSLFIWGRLGQRYHEYGDLFTAAFSADRQALDARLDEMLAQPQPASLRGSLLAFRLLIYTLRHEWSKAISFFESVPTWGSSESALGARLQVVRAYVEAGNFPEAIGQLNRVLSEPQSFRLREGIFMAKTAIYALSGDLERLANLFNSNRRILRRMPKAFASYWLGRCHMERGERSEAAVCFQEAREEIPRHHTRWRDAVDSRLNKLEESVELRSQTFHQSESYARALAALEETEARFFAIRTLLDLAHPAAATTLLALLLVALHWGQPLITNWLSRYFGQDVHSRLIVELLANVPQQVVYGKEYWRVVSAIFLHANWMHLFFNCAVLLAFGSVIERLWGRVRLLLLFLIAGIGGNLLGAYLGEGSIGSVGASGGVFGLLAAYWLSVISVHLPKHRSFKLRLILLVSLVILTDICIGLLTTNEPFALFVGARIDNWAHVGGLVTGLFLGWLLKPSFEPPKTHLKPKRPPTVRIRPESNSGPPKAL